MSQPSPPYDVGQFSHIELRPCFNCGGEGQFLEEHNAWSFSLFYTIRCRSCSHTVNYFNFSGNDASSNLSDIRNWEIISELWNFNFYSTSIASMNYRDSKLYKIETLLLPP